MLNRNSKWLVMKLILVMGLTFTTIHAKDSLSIYIKKYTKNNKAKSSNGRNITAYKVERTAKKYLGQRYVFGKLDCSSFVQRVYKTLGKKLPRTANAQASVGKHIPKHKLQKGDLVFFKNTYKRGISHVGIYLGKDKFIHASSGAKKVTISKLSKQYYQKHYAGARRV